MNSIKLDCKNCNHCWEVTYQQLQKTTATYRGAGKEQGTVTEEYHVKCPNCGDVGVHTILLKRGQVQHGGN